MTPIHYTLHTAPPEWLQMHGLTHAKTTCMQFLRLNIFFCLLQISHHYMESLSNSHLGPHSSCVAKYWCGNMWDDFCACCLLSIYWLLCKQVKQLDPGAHCLRLHRRAGQHVEVRYMAPGELLRDVVRRGNTHDPTRTLQLSALSIMCIDLFNIAPQVNDQLEVVPANVFTLHMSRQSGSGDFGESGTFGRIVFVVYVVILYVILRLNPPGRFCSNRIRRQPEEQQGFCQRSAP